MTSVGTFTSAIPTAVILYDLIPYIYPEKYLTSREAANWYLEKIGHLRNADLLLAISESSRREAIEHLSFPSDQTANISTAADDHFTSELIQPDVEEELRSRYRLNKPFLMYTGGIDHRKT